MKLLGMHNYCPNCHAVVPPDAKACASCDAQFTSDGWLPLTELPESAKRPSAASLVVKLGIASVIIPAAGFLIGLILASIIPGCHCDEGAGCSGCGANGMISFLLFGGFVGSIAACITVLPGSFVLAALISLFSGKRT